MISAKARIRARQRGGIANRRQAVIRRSANVPTIHSLPLVTALKGPQFRGTHSGSRVDPKLAVLARIYFKKNRSKNKNCQALMSALGARLRPQKSFSGKYLYSFLAGRQLTAPIRTAVDLLYAEKVLHKRQQQPRRIAGTFVPFHNQHEQRRVLAAVPPQRRRVLLVAEYKRRTKRRAR